MSFIQIKITCYPSVDSCLIFKLKPTRVFISCAAAIRDFVISASTVYGSTPVGIVVRSTALVLVIIQILNFKEKSKFRFSRTMALFTEGIYSNKILYL